jgi:hypothetical protein
MRKQEEFIKIEVNFLQSIVDYLKKRPYEEVFEFLNVLLNPEVGSKDEQKDITKE